MSAGSRPRIRRSHKEEKKRLTLSITSPPCVLNRADSYHTITLQCHTVKDYLDPCQRSVSFSGRRWDSSCNSLPQQAHQRLISRLRPVPSAGWRRAPLLVERCGNRCGVGSRPIDQVAPVDIAVAPNAGCAHERRMRTPSAAPFGENAVVQLLRLVSRQPEGRVIRVAARWKARTVALWMAIWSGCL
jgi:hypothetical protein